VGESKNGLVYPLKPVLGNFVKQQGQDNGDREFNEETPGAYNAGITESPKEKRLPQYIFEILEIVPGAPGYTLGVIKRFERKANAVHGKIRKNDIEQNER
jgi:hypothetical protein